MSGEIQIDLSSEPDLILEQVASVDDISPNIRNFVSDNLRNWFNNEIRMQLHTSGSTGEPKPVILESELLNWSVKASVSALKMANEHSLIVIPVNKTGGAMQLFRAFVHQWKITIREPSSNPLSEPIPDDISNISITPFQLSAILRNEDSLQRLRSIRTILVGGGNIPFNDLRLLKDAGITGVYHTYGMTETAGHVALSDPAVGVFVPLDGVQVSRDSRGCARITIKDAAIDVQTNDVIEFRDNGFEVLGRADHIVNSGGLKLNPEELERKIRVGSGTELPPFFLYGLPDPVLGQKLVMIAVDDAEISVLEESISVLKGAEKPKAIHKVPQFFYTETSKLDRKKSAAQIS